VRGELTALWTDNPFAQREEFSRQSLLAYKNSTILSWLLLVVVGTYYTFDRPADCHHHNNCHTIWGQNSHRKTPFSLSPVVTNIYWITVLIMQLDYIRFLWSADKFLVTIAANVGSHFILVGPRPDCWKLPAHLTRCYRTTSSSSASSCSGCGDISGKESFFSL